MATIKIIKSKEDLRSLKSTWCDVVSGSSRARAFQTYEWTESIWCNYHEPRGDRLFILDVTRDGHDEHVIFPFCINTDGCLKFIAAVYADYLDAICKDHTNNWHALYADVIKFLIECKDFKTMQFDKLPPDSEMLGYFGGYLEGAEISRQMSYSYLKLARSESVIDACSHLNSKERSYLRSLLRKRPELRYRRYSLDIGDPYPRSQVKDLRDRMISSGIRVLASIPDEMLVFVEDVYNRGVCDIAVLEDDRGEFCLVSTRLKCNNTINFWLVLHSSSDLPTIADARYLDQAVKSGDKIFDWGIGVYSYKLGTFRPLVNNLYCFRYGRYGLSDFYRTLRTTIKRILRG